MKDLIFFQTKNNVVEMKKNLKLNLNFEFDFFFLVFLYTKKVSQKRELKK